MSWSLAALATLPALSARRDEDELVSLCAGAGQAYAECECETVDVGLGAVDYGDVVAAALWGPLLSGWSQS